ncbi:MAG TPA: aminodeoxychorismate synthase component I, partial [Galbitalea sp.]
MRHGPLRHALARWVDPADAFVTLFAGQSDVAWLDCGPEAASGRSYIAGAARVVTSESLGRSTPGPSAPTPSILDFLRDELAAGRVVATDGERFGPGWFGWLGYENRHETMGDPSRTAAESAFLFADRLLEFDHETRVVTLVALGESWAGEFEDWRRDTVSALEHPDPGPAPDGAPGVSRTALWRDSDADYLTMIGDCKAAIARGDAYLLCLTTSVSIETSADPLQTYLALRRSSPSHHGG